MEASVRNPKERKRELGRKNVRAKDIWRTKGRNPGKTGPAKGPGPETQWFRVLFWFEALEL